MNFLFAILTELFTSGLRTASTLALVTIIAVVVGSLLRSASDLQCFALRGRGIRLNHNFHLLLGILVCLEPFGLVRAQLNSRTSPSTLGVFSFFLDSTSISPTQHERDFSQKNKNPFKNDYFSLSLKILSGML